MTCDGYCESGRGGRSGGSGGNVKKYNSVVVAPLAAADCEGEEELDEERKGSKETKTKIHIRVRREEGEKPRKGGQHEARESFSAPSFRVALDDTSLSLSPVRCKAAQLRGEWLQSARNVPRQPYVETVVPESGRLFVERKRH
jgi:hypothetical protein